jgi:hypothetical protein
MIININDVLKFSNPQGFIYESYFILNSINRKIDFKIVNKIKVTKVKSNFLNQTFLLLSVFFITLYCFKLSDNNFYFAFFSLLFLGLYFKININKYYLSIDLANAENIVIKINKNCEEDYKNLAYLIEKKINPIKL